MSKSPRRQSSSWACAARRGVHALTLLAATLTSSLVAAPAQAGTIVRETFASPTLKREAQYTVYLPDGYAEATTRYPVVYLLHGASGDEWTWIRQGGATETLDGLVKRGLIRPSVVVMPTMGASTWWANGVVDAAETALMDEIIPRIEQRFKVATDRPNRAIGGLSMGGYGALNLSLRFPEKFCGAAVISPAIYDPLPPETSAARRTPQFVRNGAFDAETWKSLNYPAHLDKYKAGKARVPMWIVSGDHDFLGIALMSAQLYWRLYQIQPKQVELRIVDGDHEWLVFRDALPEALQYVDRMCQKG